MKNLMVKNSFFNNLKKLNVTSLNIESDLFIYNNDYLIKKYLDDDQELLAEKEYKVSSLMEKNIDGTIPVIAKIICDDAFCGYLMPYIKNSCELNQVVKNNLSKNELIKIMISISDCLENMHLNNIVYGDISGSNIIVDEYLTPYFVDMDGAVINDFGYSNIPKLLFNNKFIDDFTPSKELDIFLINILFVNILSGKNVSIMEKEELLEVVDKLDIGDELKNYFSLIPNGIQSEYPKKYLSNEIKSIIRN